MALWMTALKLVPWGNVIEATPKIVKGAHTLFTNTLRKQPGAGASAKSADPAGDAALANLARDPTAVEALMQALQARVAVVEEGQHASAELIRSLAEQNAEIVPMVDAMRRRLRLLSSVCLVLVITVLMLVVRVAGLT